MQLVEIKTKDLSVETLRGIAIILMVAGHVIGASPNSGLKVYNDSGWRYFYHSFEYLRMPLFTVISGFVYSLRPVEKGKFLNFLKGKARRILLPMISVSTLHFLIQFFVPGTNSTYELHDIWRIFIFQYEHFWFLQAIFLIFIFIALIDNFNLISSIGKWLMVFLLTVIGRSFLPHYHDNFFSYGGFLNLLPFFLLGCGIERFQELFKSRIIIRIFLVLFVLAVIIQQYFLMTGIILNDIEFTVLSLFVAGPGITLLFFIRRQIPVLSKLGRFAYGIYLFHVFGSAGSRIILLNLGVTNNLVLFSAGLSAGLVLPIIIELLLENSVSLRMLLLGLKRQTVQKALVRQPLRF